MKHLNTSSTPETEKDQAQTPWWAVRSLESLLGVKFDLDVCCLPHTKKAPRGFSLAEHNNGLSLPWYKSNFCNPPFSEIHPWIEKAVYETSRGNSTAMILPDNTETAYLRAAQAACDTMIRMPFRLQFLRPDGSRFTDKHGKPQSPQFPCAVAWFTPLGSASPSRETYHDFRVGFYGKKS